MSSLFFCSDRICGQKNNGLIIILHIMLFPVYFELINLKNAKEKMQEKKVCLIIALKTAGQNTSTVSSYQKSSDVEQNCRPVMLLKKKKKKKFIIHPMSHLT